jgi:hypothetical protein
LLHKYTIFWHNKTYCLSAAHEMILLLPYLAYLLLGLLLFLW